SLQARSVADEVSFQGEYIEDPRVFRRQHAIYPRTNGKTKNKPSGPTPVSGGGSNQHGGGHYQNIHHPNVANFQFNPGAQHSHGKPKATTKKSGPKPVGRRDLF